MGSKNKFWYHSPDEKNKNWLFKYPKQNTGEHWAEKIAAEMASALRIKHAEVELAICEGNQGSVTRSFARGGRELWHGNQVLARVFQEYNPEAKHRNSNHTLGNIWQALDAVYRKPESARKAKLSIAEYIVLDALIGNTDRHHENWGFLRKLVDSKWRGQLAPSFDHASSLGRELLDERRTRFLEEDRLGKYAEKGRGGIYWADEGGYGPSPLELARLATREYPEFFRPALNKLQNVDDNSISSIINRVPAGWMTPPARQFAHELTCYNLNELRRITL